MLAIQVAELRFATEEGVWVLENLSFSVRRDGFVWVVGPPGSGKTLLLRILLREVRPHGGQILLLGRNILRLSPKKFHELRRKVGYVSEEVHVLSGRTVLGNLNFKLRALGIGGEAAKEAIERALDLAELHGYEQAYAKDLEPLELRRLGLALALCPDASVLLVDDPLRGLGKLEQDALLSTLERINQAGVTLLATSREAQPLLSRGFTSNSSAHRAIIYLREGAR